MQNILEEITENLSNSENLVDCKIENHTDSKGGDGMVAIIFRLSFSGKDEKNYLETKNLILKMAPSHYVLTSSTPIQEMYQNEINAYQIILPALKEVCEALSMDFVKYPKHYISKIQPNESYLVLEDLKSSGYRMWNNKKIMNDDHIFLVLDNLAKLHAPSFHLKAANQKIWNALINNCVDVSKVFFGETEFCNSIKDMADTLDNLFEGQQEVLESFRKFRDEGMAYFMTEVCRRYDPDFVVVHGDLWSNNVLFKYEDNGSSSKPIEVAFLDFQHIRVSSVAIDLSYFLYTAATKEIMSSIDVYLSYYYENLSKNLTKMGLNPKKVYPYSSFLHQWKEYNKFGFSMALVVLHGISSDSDEFPNLDDIVKSGKNYWYALNFLSRNEKKYQQKIKDVILHFAHRGYL